MIVTNAGDELCGAGLDGTGLSASSSHAPGGFIACTLPYGHDYMAAPIHACDPAVIRGLIRDGCTYADDDRDSWLPEVSVVKGPIRFHPPTDGLPDSVEVSEG